MRVCTIKCIKCSYSSLWKDFSREALLCMFKICKGRWFVIKKCQSITHWCHRDIEESELIILRRRKSGLTWETLFTLHMHGSWLNMQPPPNTTTPFSCKGFIRAKCCFFFFFYGFCSVSPLSLKDTMSSAAGRQMRQSKLQRRWAALPQPLPNRPKRYICYDSLKV